MWSATALKWLIWIFVAHLCMEYPLKNIPRQMPRLRRLTVFDLDLEPVELLDELVSKMPKLTVIKPWTVLYGDVITQGGWCK